MPRRFKARKTLQKKSPRNSRRKLEEEEDESDISSDHDEYCAVCGDDGEVLCCDSCTGVYHLTCLDPPLPGVPDGEWYCPKCDYEDEEEEEEEEDEEEFVKIKETQRLSTNSRAERYRMRTTQVSPSKKSTTRSTVKQENKMVEKEETKEIKKNLRSANKKQNNNSNNIVPSKRTTRSQNTSLEESSGDSEETMDSESDESLRDIKPKTQKNNKPKTPKGRTSGKSFDIKSKVDDVTSTNGAPITPPLSPSSQIDFTESISQPLVPISNLPIVSKPRTQRTFKKEQPTFEQKYQDEDEDDEEYEEEDDNDDDEEEDDEVTNEDKEEAEVPEELVELVEENIDAYDDMEDEAEKNSEKVMHASIYDDAIHKFENVEKILAWKPHPEHPDDENLQIFLVKWEDKSYRQCTWIPKPILMVKNKPKLKSFERMEYNSCESDDLAEIFNPQYLKVHRIIAKKVKKDTVLYLVKWKGLSYEQATWEPVQEVEGNTKLMKQFEEFNNPSRFNFTKLRKKPSPYRTQPKFLHGGTLHPYQLEGLNWLLLSWFNRRNVILADEMGLGKTIQIISFIATLNAKYTKGPILIVTPASVLRNWGREFSKWAPQVNVVRYYGCKKSRSVIRKHEFFFNDSLNSKKSRKMLKFNVLLTSFDIVFQDENILKKYNWEMIVIDEAQRLKNRHSKLLQILHHFTLKHKVLLTGTPLQNNLKELFVLLNFIDEVKFPSETEFLKQCAINNDEQISNIHKMITPYILRRLKADVLQNLPTKNDFIVRVDLSDLQKSYYRAILQKNFESIKKNYNVTNVLIELIKCCDHPYLILPDQEDDNQSQEKSLELLVNSCGKLKLVDKLLDKLKERGHRVLIFSKMTKMLDIFEDYLFYKNFKFERLDGSTNASERQEKIDRFNATNSDIFCFLLSTRAGGIGINLASADTVIIYDSDWNPHNDLQALSRSHRIGQEKPVMVYRLVTRGTVEERIIQISKQKMMIEHLVFEKMNSKGETILKKGELDDILRFGVQELFNEGDSGPAIVYDDQSIEKLLDRSEESQMEKENHQNEYLNSFKVAPYKTEEELNSSNFWDSIFSAPNAKVDTLELYGRGKRLRTSNQLLSSPFDKDFSDHYTSEEEEEEEEMEEEEEEDEDEDEDEDALEIDDDDGEEDYEDTETEEKRKTKKRKFAEFAKDNKVIEDPLIEGKGKELKVNGFSLVQRSALLKLVMSFGLKDGSFTHLAEKKFGFLRAKSDVELQEYSKLVMKHILEPPSNSPNYQDGIPKDRNFPLKEVLYRIVSIHLISNKIANTKDAKSFSINDRGWTELSRWWNEPNQIWTKEHDFILLQAVLKHGYGKWGEILQDSEVGLFGVSQLAVGRKIPENKPPSNSPFQQLCRAAKDSDNDTPESSQLANAIAPFHYKPDNTVTRFMRRRIQTLENALFVEFQFLYPNVHAALIQSDKNDPYTDGETEDENARKFLDTFKDLYNRAYNLLDHAKAISSITPAFPQYREEIERQKKALGQLDNIALEARSVLSKVKVNSL